MLSTTEHQLMFSKQLNWVTWLIHIKHEISAINIWSFIDPNIAIKPKCLKELIPPSLDTAKRFIDPTAKALAMKNYKIKKII